MTDGLLNHCEREINPVGQIVDLCWNFAQWSSYDDGGMMVFALECDRK